MTLTNEQFIDMMKEIKVSHDIDLRLNTIESIVKMTQQSNESFRTDLVSKIDASVRTAQKANERIDAVNTGITRILAFSGGITAFIGVVMFILKLTGKL